MGLSRRQLKRLEGKCGPPPTAVALQEARSREAMPRLTDEELDHLDSALARGFDPQKDRQDVMVTPSEQAAYLRFETLYEETLNLPPEALRGGNHW